jgi:hypothetical protein
MIENINQVESSLGLAEGTLQEAIASEDAKTIEIPVGKFIDTEKHVIRTTEEHETYLGNIREESKKAGLEIAVKGARTDLNYDFEGKTLENLLKAHGDSVLKGANIEPSAKLEELTGDMDKLKAINLGLEDKYKTLVSESHEKDNRRKIDGSILDSMTGEFTLPKNQLSTLFKAEYQVVEEDGKQLVKQNGETLKNDSTLDPLSLSDIMPKFLEQFAKKATGGAGGGDTTDPGKAGSMEAFIKEMNDKGVSSGSEAFNIEMGKRISDKTLTM